MGFGGNSRWSFWKTFGLAFGSVFSALFGFTQPSWLADLIWRWEPLGDAWSRAWEWQTGSSWHGSEGVDTSFYWRMTLVILVESLAVSGVWAAVRVKLGRGEPHYDRAWSRLSLWLGVVLASELIGPGIHKLFTMHGEPPSLFELMQPLGEFRRTDFAWLSLGISPLYSAVAGAMQIFSGSLVLFARTRALGAMLSVVTVGYIVITNLGYDVYAKRQSLVLLAIALVLLSPSAKNLVDVLLLDRPTSPKPRAPLFGRRLPHRVIAILVPALMLGNGAWQFSEDWALFARHGSGGLPQPPLRGIWQVESARACNGWSSPDIPEPARWRLVVIDFETRYRFYRPMAEVRTTDGPVRESSSWYFTDFPKGKNAVELWAVGPQTHRVTNHERPAAVFNYAHPSADQLVLTGDVADSHVEVWLRRIDEATLPLNDHPGINWVREAPVDHSGY